MVALPLLEKYTNQSGFLSLVVEHIINIHFTHELNLAMKNWKYLYLYLLFEQHSLGDYILWVATLN